MNAKTRFAAPVLLPVAMFLAACGGGSADDKDKDGAAALTPSGRVTATRALTAEDLAGVWSAEGLMGISLAGGRAVQRAASSDAGGVAVPREEASWRVVDNILVYKKDGSTIQDECVRAEPGNAPLTLTCTTIGGANDGLRLTQAWDPVDLPAELPGIWLNDGGLGVDFQADGRFTASTGDEAFRGTWRVDGLRLTLRSDGTTSTCDFSGRNLASIYLACHFDGEDSEYLTLWHSAHDMAAVSPQVPEASDPLQEMLLELIGSEPTVTDLNQLVALWQAGSGLSDAP